MFSKLKPKFGSFKSNLILKIRVKVTSLRTRPRPLCDQYMVQVCRLNSKGLKSYCVHKESHRRRHRQQRQQNQKQFGAVIICAVVQSVPLEG